MRQLAAFVRMKAVQEFADGRPQDAVRVPVGVFRAERRQRHLRVRSFWSCRVTGRTDGEGPVRPFEFRDFLQRTVTQFYSVLRALKDIAKWMRNIPADIRAQRRLMEGLQQHYLQLLQCGPTALNLELADGSSRRRQRSAAMLSQFKSPANRVRGHRLSGIEKTV